VTGSDHQKNAACQEQEDAEAHGKVAAPKRADRGVDGAGPVRSFFAVTIPMVREMTTLLIILTISGAFLVFNEVQVMTAGGPSDSSQVLGTWLYRNAFLADDMGYASAIATVIFVITFGFAALQLTLSRRKRIEW